MLLLPDYQVKHKKFGTLGTVIDVSRHHVQVDWKDVGTRTYTHAFAKEILERV
jgi:hypothetical protein